MDKAEKYWSAETFAGDRQKSGVTPFAGGMNTPRLRLRRPRNDDAHTITRLVSDWEVSKQTISIINPYTLDDAFRFIRDGEADWKKGRQYVLCMERRSDSALIGTVSIQIYRKWGLRYGEIGYWAGRDYWGEGYTSEAVEPFLVFCRSTLGLRRITARVFVENEASLRLLKSNGFRQVSRRTEVLPHRGGKRKIIHLRHKGK
jgi:RimJ/RimL family protein N-acetyltransferase